MTGQMRDAFGIDTFNTPAAGAVHVHQSDLRVGLAGSPGSMLKKSCTRSIPSSSGIDAVREVAIEWLSNKCEFEPELSVGMMSPKAR